MVERYAVKFFDIFASANMNTVEGPGKHGLLLSTAKTFRWSLLAGVFPRLCLTGFTYAQPFLITTLINHVESSDVKSNAGYALIGAYLLVFFGAAVSCPHHGVTWD